MTAKIDLQSNSSITLNKDGYRASRVAMVSGVTGTAAEVLFNAINDAQLPDIGDAHPDIAAITLQDVTCSPLGGGNFKVVMNYFKDAGSVTTSAAAESRCNAGLAVEETLYDVSGTRLKTAYSSGAGSTRQVFTAEVERPRITYEFEYTSTAFPTGDIQKYVGKINSTVWNGHAVGTIMCSGIDVSQSGTDYRVSYSFAYKKEGWQFNAQTFYSPPLTAHPSTPDAALDLTTGVRTFDVYSSVDFGPLGFELVDLSYTLVSNAAQVTVTGFDADLVIA